MVYVTVKLPPFYHQISLEELWFGEDTQSYVLSYNGSNTRTYERETLSDVFRKKADIYRLIEELYRFNNMFEPLRRKDRKSLYHSFKIPKKNGKMRQIDAPLDDLMYALRYLKSVFEDKFKVLYHTSAFAYIKQRSTIDAVKRHQSNESKWFAKFDLSNFFGSTTPEFLYNMFAMVYPFSEVVNHTIAIDGKTVGGKNELQKALDLCFLNGGLPQGTPISPLLTNVMMIPVDFKLANTLREKKMVYTRYADDFLVSSKYAFDPKEVERTINDVLASFNAPFRINNEKTRYGSSSGRNWNLGVMLNSDNNITIGHEKKRRFKAMLTNYTMDKMNGTPWDLEQVQKLQGIRSYYTSIEKDNIDKIITNLSMKFNFDIANSIKCDLSVG